MNSDIEFIEQAFQEASMVLRRTDIDKELFDLTISNTLSVISHAQENPTKLTLRLARDSIAQLYNAAFTQHQSDQNSRQARIDSLTQAGNKLAFSEQLNQVIENEQASPSQYHTAVFLFDLDRFKGLNDNYGHEAGDAGLRAFSQILKKITRQHDNKRSTANQPDMIFEPKTPTSSNCAISDFRCGGDEFALIATIKANNYDDAKAKCDKLLSRIKKELAVQYFEYDGMTFPLVSSVGMHVIEEGDNAMTVCKKADIELFKHKETKTQRYEFCAKTLEEQGFKNIQIIEDVRGQENKIKQDAKIGEAISDLNEAGGVTIYISPDTRMPNAMAAIKTLQQKGIAVACDLPDNSLG